MGISITHLDSDGIISAYLINKYVERTKRIFFSNPERIKDTIARSFMEEWEIDRLFILDIAGNERALRLASVYDNVIWIDHHEWYLENKYNNIEITLMDEPSAARVISKKYGINDPIVEMADHLDQNLPRNETEIGFRDMISSIRNLYHREREKKLESLVFEMINSSVDKIIERNKNYILNFRNEMEKIKEEIKSEILKKNLNGRILVIVKTDKNIPVYKIQEILHDEWDVLAVIYYRHRFWKIELRSKELDILPVARIYGGGGHKRAAGASLYENPDISELIKIIETISRG